MKICITGHYHITGDYNGNALEDLTQRGHEITYDKSQLADCDIAFGQPDVQTVIESEKLRWVHLSSAGYTNYDNDQVRAALKARNAILTNSSSVYDEPCAQHALAMILAFARRLPYIWQDSTRHEWNTRPHRERSFLLNGQTVLFLGYGAIGKRLSELLKPFHLAEIYALRQKERGNESATIIYKDELEVFLPAAEHVINLLPESDSTRGFMDSQRIAHMQPGAFYYSIGRGATTNQEALRDALNSGHLSGAYLDVTSPEPLPAEHPLWRAPNCFITPHSAGGHADEDIRLVRHFLANLHAFESGKALHDVVFS